MKLIEKLLSKFNGLHYRQEYLCLALESFTPGLNVYIARDGKAVKDVTACHVFAGYCPLVFALPSGIDRRDQLHLIFTLHPLIENGEFSQKDVLAELMLEKIHGAPATDVVFYRGIHGRHRFLSFFNRFIIGLNNSLFSKKTGNVFLKGNLLTQVQIAYAIPRRICLITVGGNDRYNLFPTDLHGPIDDGLYVISLRHEGKACGQVMGAGRLVLSDMEAAAFKEVYALGKNHMQPLKERAAFDFGDADTPVFKLPIPSKAVAYRELEVVESFVEGIHRLFIFRIINKTKIAGEAATLAHIHNVCATWRENKGLNGNYLLR